MKCDEGKPSCERCIRFGAVCEGYEVESRVIMWTNPGSTKLLPKAKRQQPTSMLSPITRVSSNTGFHDTTEYSYFTYFRQEAAIDISSDFDDGLFNRVIIQSSWHEPSLCQLLASLGALYKSEGVNSLNRPTEETQRHRQYALQQYGRALKSVQTRISADQREDTTRLALIAALLVYCFENLYGDHESAIKHLKGGLELMKKQLSRAGRQYKHAENSSPAVYLDGDLVGAFFRLDSGLATRDDISDTGHVGSRLGTYHLADSCEIPEAFYSISEARNYLESIQFPVVVILSNDLAKASMPPFFKSIDEKTRDIYMALSSQVREWDTAFARLCDRTKGKKDFVAAATLRVRAISTDLAALRICAQDQSALENLDSIGREVINLSNLVASSPGFLKSFVWDCGIVPGLSIVVAACIDMEVRKEALQALKDMIPRREGTWDSITAVKFGEACLQMTRQVG